MGNYESDVHLLERALRQAIIFQLGSDGWYNSLGGEREAKLEKLRHKREEESKRRGGVSIPSDLVEYLEFYELSSIIDKNWENFKPIFGDRKKFNVFLGFIESVRNSVAHSRPLVEYELSMVMGISGLLRNQVAESMSRDENLTRNYPIIESLQDATGRQATWGKEGYAEDEVIRLSCGDSMKIRGTALMSRGKDISWFVKFVGPWGDGDRTDWTKAASGTDVEVEYTFDDKHVGDNCMLVVRILSESRFHRYPSGYFANSHFPQGHDDEKVLFFSIDPPRDG